MFGKFKHLDLGQLWLGYSNLAKSKLWLLDKNTEVLKSNRLEVCKNCPIRSKFLGVSYCDVDKSEGEKSGCGCVLQALASCATCECSLGKWEK